MEILRAAIAHEGGQGKLARKLGVKTNVISNWHQRGVPKAWAALLQLKYKRKLKESK
jgi:hypothetical protein